MGSTEKIIAIIELCVYIPIFLLTLVVVFRHGFQRQLGWIYLAIFCVVRVTGAGFQIASQEHPGNSTDVEWAAILQSVGLSPLLMASLGLLKRITDEVTRHEKNEMAAHNFALRGLAVNSGIAKRIVGKVTAVSRRSRIIQFAQLPTMIALILCITGGNDEASSQASDHSTGLKDTKAGVIMFLIIYIILFVLVVITIRDVGNAPRGEKRIYYAVLAALPPLAVRLIWSILAAFSNNSTFSITGGKPIVQLFMAIIEEFAIVTMYTVAGLTTAN